MSFHEASFGRQRAAGRNWCNHSRHADAFAWLPGKSLVICPLSELGFLRISTNQRAINAPMDQARTLLERFLDERKVELPRLRA